MTGTPTYSPLYAATEGFIGVNIWPMEDQRRYLLHPKAMFFEFIPIDDRYVLDQGVKRRCKWCYIATSQCIILSVHHHKDFYWLHTSFQDLHLELFYVTTDAVDLLQAKTLYDPCERGKLEAESSFLVKRWLLYPPRQLPWSPFCVTFPWFDLLSLHIDFYQMTVMWILS